MSEVKPENRLSFDEVVTDACIVNRAAPLALLSTADAVIAHTRVDSLDSVIEDIGTQYTRVHNLAEDVFGQVASKRERLESSSSGACSEEQAEELETRLEQAENDQAEAAAELPMIELSMQQAIEIDTRRIKLAAPMIGTVAVAFALAFAGGASTLPDPDRKPQSYLTLSTPYVKESMGLGVGGFFGIMSGLAMSGKFAQKRAQRIAKKAEAWTVK